MFFFNIKLLAVPDTGVLFLLNGEQSDHRGQTTLIRYLKRGLSPILPSLYQKYQLRLNRGSADQLRLKLNVQLKLRGFLS
jgi:hypothetical protein